MSSTLLVIGHRGAPHEAPENTLASLERAVELGANAVEVDLVSTADGHVVLWHDVAPNAPVALAREIGLEAGLDGGGFRPSPPLPGSPLRRPAHELTLEEFLASHGYAGSGPASEAPVATLAELAQWAAAEPRLEALYLDLKLDLKLDLQPDLQPDKRAEALAEDAARLDGVLDAIEGQLSGRVPRIFVLHSEEAAVRRMIARPLAATLRAVWDHAGPGGLNHALRVGLRDVCLGVSLTHRFDGVREEAAEAVDARARAEIDTVVVWSFDDAGEQEAFLELGVDGVMTKRPGQLRALHERRRAAAGAREEPEDQRED